MGETKEISKKSYVWSHVAVIIFHTLVGLALIMNYYRTTLLGFRSKSFLLYLGWFLVILSLLSLVPILKDYDKLVIE